MMKSIFPIIILAVLACACTEKKTAEMPPVPASVDAVPDTMRYGLVCESNSADVLSFLPFVTGADPVDYSIKKARAAGRVIGQLQTGDWVGVMLNPNDTSEVVMAVNLDQLKGTWIRQVMPEWKEKSEMSDNIIERLKTEDADSLRKVYMVPREYGFTLKRSSEATPVLPNMHIFSKEKGTPVKYPAMKAVTGWKCRNGQLILKCHDMPAEKPSGMDAGAKSSMEKGPVATYDTLNFVFMNADSLVLRTQSNETVIMRRSME